MHRKELQSQLVRVVQHEISQHMRRTTGYDVRCYVTEDLNAVVGTWSPQSGETYHFAIPIVVTEECTQEAPVGPMPVGAMPVGAMHPMSYVKEGREVN